MSGDLSLAAWICKQYTPEPLKQRLNLHSKIIKAVSDSWMTVFNYWLFSLCCISIAGIRYFIAFICILSSFYNLPLSFSKASCCNRSFIILSFCFHCHIYFIQTAFVEIKQFSSSVCSRHSQQNSQYTFLHQSVISESIVNTRNHTSLLRQHRYCKGRQRPQWTGQIVPPVGALVIAHEERKFHFI